MSTYNDLRNAAYDNAVLSQPQYAQGLLNNAMAGTSSNLGQYAKQMEPRPRFLSMHEQALSHEAFATPVETLVNLWLNRYGSGWVDKKEVVHDEFYSIAAQRLIKLARMEEFELGDIPKTVLRVVV